MRYPYGGGLSAQGRARREKLRLQAAQMFGAGYGPGAGRREDARAAIQEAAGLYRELTATLSDACHHELEQLFRVVAWLQLG